MARRSRRTSSWQPRCRWSTKSADRPGACGCWHRKVVIARQIVSVAYKLVERETITKVAARLPRRHGLESSLHGLRHFWAAALISSGADISAVSKAMGHANIAVTNDIYGSLFDKSAAEMFERGAALIPRRGQTAKEVA
ncbi:tyrosine-type recombinase/integrase [Actinoplanes sp. NEAU-A12]|uniref:Tyrosine-type recombinase/integrase n=1 Tax=Actinoplanes sandaracinus TaxID=3045177 RepID=A0ABT6WSV1_9ACTN|nr:tyrosine-type recombinase/integrase [Actinoplanes sandaracinus]MDI6102818.1 tyrosine-type recombinase/integrase [Actinoplanes sandaracinus]